MSKKIVVIGGVAAGPKTACRVKRLLPDAVVVVVDQDNLISYGGCGIPYFVSGDVSDEKELRSTSFHVVRDEVFFNDAKVHFPLCEMSNLVFVHYKNPNKLNPHF